VTVLHDMSDFWTVTVPSWGTAIGTVGLAAFTLAVVRGDQTDRRKRDNDALRNQARRVRVTEPPRPEARQRPDTAWDVWTEFSVINDSDDVISAITCTPHLDPWTEVLYPLAVEPGGGVTRLMPGESRDFQVSSVVRNDRGAISRHLAFTVSVVFVDAAGFIWRRDEQHRLELLARPSTPPQEKQWWPRRSPNG
jgi:hypothetical protein